MGENGAGKSTLIKALTGVYQVDSGDIYVADKERHFKYTSDAQDAGVSTVYQEINLCTNLSIGENVMLGNEVRGAFGINWSETHRHYVMLGNEVRGAFGINWSETHPQAEKALELLDRGHLDKKWPRSTVS